MDFYDEVEANKEQIWQKQSRSINQQFIRVRLGGQYDTNKGNNEIWFRVGSVGYNWINQIYVFTK